MKSGIQRRCELKMEIEDMRVASGRRVERGKVGLERKRAFLSVALFSFCVFDRPSRFFPSFFERARKEFRFSLLQASLSVYLYPFSRRVEFQYHEASLFSSVAPGRSQAMSSHLCSTEYRNAAPNHHAREGQCRRRIDIFVDAAAFVVIASAPPRRPRGSHGPGSRGAAAAFQRDRARLRRGELRAKRRY